MKKLISFLKTKLGLKDKPKEPTKKKKSRISNK